MPVGDIAQEALVIARVGLTGLNASGKGLAASVLKKFGYAYFSLSDIVREETAARGLELTRDNLIRVGIDLRTVSNDPGILARRLLNRLVPLSVIDSIRTPEEINVLREMEDFILIGVQADARTRFARMQGRARPGDALDFEQFQRHEARETTGDIHAPQLHVCMQLADMVIDNNGTVEDFREKIITACRIAV